MNNMRGKDVNYPPYDIIKEDEETFIIEFALSGFSKDDLNITACLSDKKEDIIIYIDSEFSALNSIYLENSKNFNFKQLKKKKIQTKVFSEIVEDSFDFLNIDCEGNDYKIIKTIDLKKYKPKLINIEVSKENKNYIYNYLNQNGYELLAIKALSHIFKIR